MDLEEVLAHLKELYSEGPERRRRLIYAVEYAIKAQTRDRIAIAELKDAIVSRFLADNPIHWSQGGENK